MALTPEQIDDFTNLTLKKFNFDKWTDISLDLQEYVAPKMLQDKKVMVAGGQQINFKVQTKNTGNAKNTGMYAQEQTNVEDLTVDANVPWTKQTTSVAWDIDEPEFQSDRETIIRVLDVRERSALSDLAELDEQNLWSAPTGTSDTRPMGIPFWIQKDATTTPGGGFNGGNPSGFTSGCAGVSSSDYPNWSNWAFGYTSVDDVLIQRVKKAMAFTHFMAPVPHPELGFGDVAYAIYTTYRVQEPLERRAESRNDNLGADLAKYLNAVVIGGVPTKWVPYLENNDTSDPLYGVCWRHIRPVVKKNRNMRRSEVLKSYSQPTMRKYHIDRWMNWVGYDRRRLWVGSTS